MPDRAGFTRVPRTTVFSLGVMLVLAGALPGIRGAQASADSEDLYTIELLPAAGLDKAYGTTTLLPS